jgi:DNA-binding transcriptional ArsR family regulator
MTLFAVPDRDGLLAARFAVSPVWETQAAVQALVDERGHCFHEPWLIRVRSPASQLDLAALLAALPRRGYVPDFLVPPPRVSGQGLAAQLAEIRATRPAQVARELGWCRETVHDEVRNRLLTGLLADPERARDHLAARLQDAWTSLVAPFWVRIRTVLERDIDERSRELARHGLRRVLDGLHPKVRWTTRGLHLADGRDRIIEVGERGFLLMPSAYLWPHVAAIIEQPWLPTIIYPVAGIAGLWQAPAPPPDALGRLLGRTRAVVLACLDQPLSTTTLAAMTGLSPAGASAHLLTLRDAGLLTASRHGHEVRYYRTGLGTALMRAHGGQPRKSGARVRGDRDGQERILVGREPPRGRLQSADMGCDLVEAPEPGAPPGGPPQDGAE